MHYFSGAATPTRFHKKKPVEFREFNVQYPDAYQDSSQIDAYHGIRVEDPYRWLEEEYSPYSLRWKRDQRSITNQYLEAIPFQNAFKNRLRKLWDYERFSVPHKVQDSYYVFKNEGLQDQAVLCRLGDLDDTPRVVLDLNDMFKNQEMAIRDYAFSRNGRLLAFQVSEKGSDWTTIYLKDLQTGEVLADRVKWVRDSKISWYKDGFFYSRYPEPFAMTSPSKSVEFHQVYYHQIGTDQIDDELIFADRSNAYQIFTTFSTADENLLLIEAKSLNGGNSLLARDLEDEAGDFFSLVEDTRYKYKVIEQIAGDVLVLTNYRSPNGQLIRIKTTQPDPQNWEVVIPEQEHVLQDVKLIGNKIVAMYIRNASNLVQVYSTEGKLEKKLSLPGVGTVSEFSGSPGDDLAFFEFSSFTQPKTIYKLDLGNSSFESYRVPKVDFRPEDYITEQIYFESYDRGTIPMFIVYKKGISLDGNRPTLLVGNGGMNEVMLPEFNSTGLMLFAPILENYGVCAVANIRGGGEFGEQWHLAGTKQNKQNSFDDFQAAAEYLIDNQYTNRDKLGVYGFYHGGLLTAASLTQRPELFKVAISSSGMLDLLRYQKFTGGWTWSSEFGRSDDPDAFDYLFAISPYHSLTPDDYPATLVSVSETDARVVPAHSYKFVANLQANQLTTDPILIRIDERGSQGPYKSIGKRIEEGADILAFLFYNLQEGVIYDFE